MKAANLIFKISAIVLAALAVVCCILANFERITDAMLTIREQLATRRNRRYPVDAEDYEEWDI